MLKLILITLSVYAVGYSAKAQGLKVFGMDIKPPKAEDMYIVDGKDVPKAQASLAAAQGQKVMKCNEYVIGLTKSGSFTLQKK